jgi:hypothetical protein
VDGAAIAFATALPIIEIVIAVALLLLWTSALPGVVEAVVLLAFTGVLLRAQARQLPCPCLEVAEARYPSVPPRSFATRS